MPNIKEKLIELVDDFVYNIDVKRWYSEEHDEGLADHLIAHGVTVQGDKDTNVPTKWISVKDRLPEMYKNVLVIRTDGKIRFDAIGSLNVWYEEVWHTGNPVTHWMPLPQPPKGE